MTRSELVKQISQKNHALKAEVVEKAFDNFFNFLGHNLSVGNRIELRGFGVFSLRMRPGKIGRNPRTGESIQVPPKKHLHFKMSKQLRLSLNSFTHPDMPKK